jgi:malonyl-CoA O-methyltransferase
MKKILNKIFKPSPTQPLDKAIAWVKNNRIPNSGVKAHHKTNDVSQEVTGYLITSLYNAGEKNLALDLAAWEISVQRPDGAFVGPGTNVPYTFDTAQVVRGFLTVAGNSNNISHMEAPVFKACDFILTQIEPSGRITTPNADLWALPDGSKLSEYCNLFCIPALRDAGKKYNVSRYVAAAQKALDYYKSKPDLVEFKPQLGTLSHIFGYMMEALADLGEHELAKKGLDQAARIQKSDGAIPAYPGVDWVCSTGMAQLGLAWFKTGNGEQARRMLDYLEKIQNPSGGFYGSYGQGGQYFAKEEISWANKFFIDLYLLVKGKNV